MNFVGIDFETATGHPQSACAVGIVTVENGEIVDEFYSLIQPPENFYSIWTIRIHGITPADTVDTIKFRELFPEIKKRVQNKILVAHNASFDRGVLQSCTVQSGFTYEELNIEKWECTMRIYRSKGFRPFNLLSCCTQLGIELNHHEALSDARACAKLYLLRNSPDLKSEKGNKCKNPTPLSIMK
ncbi:MAG: 3'-5' exonuclease [Candidatus Riflebacteria bacterium]|nr:3'-5' exonuclease [Candidatus Riflebacteria bacterium]